MRSIQFVVGSLLVYCAVVACTSVVESGGNLDAGITAVGNPETSASAAVPTYEGVDEPCDKTQAGVPMKYAVHAYPGKGVDELTFVRVEVQLLQPNTIGGVTYSVALAPTLIRDGEVAATCPTGSGGMARFVIRKD